jgi:hypothetical protein
MLPVSLYKISYKWIDRRAKDFLDCLNSIHGEEAPWRRASGCVHYCFTSLVVLDKNTIRTRYGYSVTGACPRDSISQ